MAKIVIDTDALLEGASGIAAQLTNLQDMNAKLQELISRIGASWSGSSCLAYIVNMNQYADQARKMETLLNEYEKYVSNAAETFTNTDKDATARIRAAF